eukprot:CAMPEP_0182421048 /NCGR_PEP_ID=MMETSP1167-20130531/6239_1 /TAXON_ID=2988 /ORGANISM="Mallomonas Sp, Strain CCMP3275" /LENGTH=504 /DNA_ID=CAMNT_0024597773 /DNA_START=46 /DNA_END=1561 /DNA_ORIENTATION=+
MASNVLNNIDNAAKETLEEPKVSATAIRSKRRSNKSFDSLEGQDIIKTASGENESDFQSNDDTDTIIDNEGNNSQVVTDKAVQTLGLNVSGKDIPTDIRKKLISKDKEIERLNGECLELEDKCEAMKREVEEAWVTYKSAQERSVVREQELQDEIRLLQKAKQTDKQQSVREIQRLGEELEESMRQVRGLQSEKESLQLQLKQVTDSSGDWSTRERERQSEMEETRLHYQQTIQGLQDDLHYTQNTLQEIRVQHEQLLHHNHSRYTDLEKENMELTNSITDKQKEIQKLLRIIEGGGKEMISQREIDGLRQQYTSLSSVLEEERERNIQIEKKSRVIECEYKAAQVLWEDERERHTATMNELETEIAELRNKLKQSQEEKEKKHPNQSSSGLSLSLSSSAASLEQQVNSLSQQLLRKQSIVQDLQAERAALKARVLDLQNKCNKLEKRMSEEEDEGGDADLEGETDASDVELEEERERERENELKKEREREDGEKEVGVQEDED